MSDIVRRLRAGSIVVPADPKTRDALLAAKRSAATAHVFVCFSGKGYATHARTSSTSGYPRWDAAVEAAAMKLAIEPFKGASPSQTVCSDIELTTGKLRE